MHMVKLRIRFISRDLCLDNTPWGNIRRKNEVKATNMIHGRTVMVVTQAVDGDEENRMGAEEEEEDVGTSVGSHRRENE